MLKSVKKKRKKKVIYQKTSVRLQDHFFYKIFQDRNEWHNIQNAKRRGRESEKCDTLPSKIIISSWMEEKELLRQKLKAFINNKPTEKEMLKGLL